MSYIFTPRKYGTDERIKMQIVERTPRGEEEWTMIVTDAKTGKKYKAKSAACGLDCHCDAIIYGYKKE